MAAQGYARRNAKHNDRREGFWLDLVPSSKMRLGRLPNRGLFAVFYETPGPFSNASRVFVARSTRELGARLRQLVARKMIPNNGRVYVQTAASENDFTEPQYEALVWNVLNGIKTIKARGDRATLLRVRAALDRTGVTPGPKRQQYASSWKIDTLRNLAKKKKQRFEDALTHPARKRAPESARQELWKYCKEFYHWCMLANLHSPEDWQNNSAAKYFQEQFGLKFPRDLDAATEAYRRGKKTVEKRLADYDRFLESHQPRLVRQISADN
jgi:hypothetical protein